MSRLIYFFTSASAGGVLLLIATIIGLGFANSPLAGLYHHFLETPVGPLSVELWINDVLMAIFFLYVGLEVKREMIDGELNTNAKRFLPGIVAFFGLLVPGIIYYCVVGNTMPELLNGWAIPTATDIAFAIGIVSILGSRVPVAMKVFLTTLAVMDDLMVIVILAVFYASSIKLFYLLMSAFIGGALYYVNKQGYTRPIAYILLGLALWFCIFKSGIHATLAGVILAAFIPFSGMREGKEVSPVIEWEHALSNWVTFLVIPLFGFANTGVSLQGVGFNDLFHPVVLGVAGGLFLGKQLGVFGSLFFLVKMRLVDMPSNTSWLQVYGIALCCGIGFTMSLFVSLLAFPPSGAQEMAKIGIFIGSILSGLLGYLVLRLGGKPKAIALSEAELEAGQYI